MAAIGMIRRQLNQGRGRSKESSRRRRRTFLEKKGEISGVRVDPSKSQSCSSSFLSIALPPFNPARMPKLHPKTGLSLGRFQETLQLPDPGRVTHFPQGFRLDLSDALSRDAELASYFFEGAAVTVNEAKPLLEHLPFAIGQGLQDVLDLLLQQDN